MLKYLSGLAEMNPASMAMRYAGVKSPTPADAMNAAFPVPPRRPAGNSFMDKVNFALAQPGMLPIGKIGPVYHGTGEGFGGTFDHAKLGSATGGWSSRLGSFFTPDRDEAARYVKTFHRGKGQVVPAMLNEKKPYHISFSEWDKLHGDLSEWKTNPDMGWPQMEKRGRANFARFRDELLSQGHDVVVVGSPGTSRAQEIIALTPDIIENQTTLPLGKR